MTDEVRTYSFNPGEDGPREQAVPREPSVPADAPSWGAYAAHAEAAEAASPAPAHAAHAGMSEANTGAAPSAQDAAVAAPFPAHEQSADPATGTAEAPLAAALTAEDARAGAEAPATPLAEDAPANNSAADEPEASAPISPDTTAEIDTAVVESRLNDPGSTQSFPAITEERIDTDSTYDAGTTMSLMWGARSDVGCVRTHNEDSYLVQSPLFCVSDGMGGHAAGEVASSIAVETIARMAPKAADPTLLAAAVEAANAAIIEAAANGLGKPGMGCTATVAYIEGDVVALAHVGDSRAYLVHEGTLIRVTRDHSYVEELVDAGEITADEARVHPNRSVITRALGSDPAMYADHFQLNLEEGDRLILCSDGLSSMIPDGEIEQISNQSSTAQMCVDNLVDAALAAGGSDNVTVVAVDVVDDGRLREITRRRKRNIIIALVAVLATFAIAAIALTVSITQSVFLGVCNDHVAIYNGIPESFMGINLYWLNDETAIDLDDLPEDTQKRLSEGIPQSSMDAARDTVSSYWKQIDEAQTRQAIDAAVIEGATEGGGAGASADGAANASTPPAADPTPSTATTEGGTDE